MKMQDKELDDLFRSQLEGFELSPSEKVWTGITDELSGTKRRKGFYAWFGIAASVLMLITAGILFIPKKGNDVTSKSNRIAKSRVTHPVATPKTVGVNEGGQVDAMGIPHTHIVYMSEVKKVATEGKHESQTNAMLAQNKPVKVVEQSALAAMPEKQVENSSATTSRPETLVIAKQQVGSSDTVAKITKPVLIAAATTVSKPGAKQVKKRGIHNFGDLVNIVIAKVDKRKDKAIQFTDSDDDESTLTALNIGPVKIKREDKGDR